MVTAAKPLLRTVEQYREIDACDDAVQESHWGQVITVTRPRAADVVTLTGRDGAGELAVAEVFE